IANGPGLGAGVAQFNASYSNPSTLHAARIRVDHAIDSRLNLFGRFNYSPCRSKLRGPPVSRALVLRLPHVASNSVQDATTGLPHVITPRISNEIRANYSNHRVASRSVLDNFGGAAPLSDSMLFPAGYSSDDAVFGLNIVGAGQLNQGKGGTDEQ